MFYISTIRTPAQFPRRYLQIMASDEGITHIDFIDQPNTGVTANRWSQLAAQQLLDYFEHNLQQFNLPLVLHTTPFQRKVWQQLQTISYGNTLSYKELATQLGTPQACRAVGMANGKNPLPIIIPCHRVINHNGQLGGYSGGLAVKTALLALEGSLDKIKRV